MGRWNAALTIAVVASLTAGCSTVVEGTAVPDPNDPLVTLDAGGISTKPRKVETSKDQQDVLAANILAEKTLYAWDVDPTYVKLESFGVRAAAQSSNLSDVVDGADADAIGRRGMLYGFVSGRSNDAPGQREGLSVAVLRMNDEAAARGALDDHRTRVGAGAERIGDRTDIVATKRDPTSSRPNTVYAIMAAVGPHLIVVRSGVADAAKSRDHAVVAVDKQRDLLAGYTSPGADTLDSLPADKDDIVSHTVTPDPLEQGKLTLEYGFREGRAPLHWDTDPLATARLLEDSGIDLVGIGRNAVYRARDDSGAQRFVDAASRLLSKEEQSAEFSIDGLPSAKCRTYAVKGTIEMVTRATCYVSQGRYVAEYSDQQKERVRQVTSAGYLLLRDLA
ncbi:hypothetical protein [Tsukamurella sp. 1534]|uniref:DUF7373 family lipoprotein n=1 Tax=Tsukamurella sp. 1534 TaxID=1151061 RepID=UPI0002F7358B|nr:hypothetical protein [Tsukamurella sp. 1534]